MYSIIAFFRGICYLRKTTFKLLPNIGQGITNFRQLYVMQNHVNVCFSLMKINNFFF